MTDVTGGRIFFEAGTPNPMLTELGGLRPAEETHQRASLSQRALLTEAVRPCILLSGPAGGSSMHFHQWKRREFITLLGATVAWPLAVRAQQSDRMRRIGVLMPAAANDRDVQDRLAASHSGHR